MIPSLGPFFVMHIDILRYPENECIFEKEMKTNKGCEVECSLPLTSLKI